MTSYPPPGVALGCYTGTVVDGRYEIGAVLGQGGMGVVYAARHVVIGKRCAVKILRSEVARDSEIAHRFLQEAKAASSIGNPHIIDINDFGQFPDGTTYLVMEYLDGQPLSSLIKDHGALPAERLLRIARQIADGLGAAHDRGIVHRDLKPDNIMLSLGTVHPDFVKILDFGIAKVSSGPRVTMAGRLFGTPYYMSPEQASGGEVDQRTDVYALGVIMYEMASGQVPFDADTLMGILTQHVYKNPVPPHQLVGAKVLPVGLEGIILKALSKEPAQRYQSMQEIARDLEAVAAGVSPELPMKTAAARTFSPSESLNGHGMPVPLPATPRASRRRWGLYAGIVATLLTCAVGGGVLLRGSTSTAAPGPRADASSTPPADGPRAVASSAPAPVIGTPAAATLPQPSNETPPQAAGPKTTEVVFAAEPLDAHVYRGRDDLGPTPVTLQIEKNAPQTLDVRAAGYKPARIKVDGVLRRVTVKLVPVKRKAPTRKAGTEVPNGIVNPWK